MDAFSRSSMQRFLILIQKFSKVRICVIGDLMVDRFIRGKVSRISPEAPVPVVQVKEEVDLPGGAGNVMMNLAALKAEVVCCGVVGSDDVGDNLVRRFSELGIRTDNVRRDAGRSTSLKTRVIAEHQQVVRFDRETVQNISPTIEKEFCNTLPSVIKSCDGVILSDYGKGMISKSILKCAINSARKHKKPVCVDPKIEHFQSYKKVSCITPNIHEAKGGMHRLRVESKDDIIRLGKDILKALGCESALITQGEEGMTLFEKSRVTHIPAKAQEVYDVTGAGDTVISVLTLALACGASAVDAARLSNLAAGIVIGKLGTATVSPQELKEALPLL